MDNIEQNITGNNNLQVGVNNGDIIRTEKIVRKINIIQDKSDCITPAQALEISQKIKEIGSVLALDKEKSEKGKVFTSEQIAFKKQFKIHKYDVLPKDKFDEAIKWLQKRYVYKAQPKLRKEDIDSWRKDKYATIYARANQLGISKEELYIFVNDILKHKKYYNSLSDLSPSSLNKVYNKILAKTKK